MRFGRYFQFTLFIFSQRTFIHQLSTITRLLLLLITNEWILLFWAVLPCTVPIVAPSRGNMAPGRGHRTRPFAAVPPSSVRPGRRAVKRFRAVTSTGRYVSRSLTGCARDCRGPTDSPHRFRHGVRPIFVDTHVVDLLVFGGIVVHIGGCSTRFESIE